MCAWCAAVEAGRWLLPKVYAGREPEKLNFLCPTKQGGCEDEHQRMDYMARDKFYAAHNEDQ